LKIAGLSLAATAFSTPDFSNLTDSSLEVNRLSSDVLSLPTQEAIAAYAESLIRLDPDAADAMADDLRDAKYSSAGNICGPLSAAPLLGTVITGYKTSDFWEVNATFCDGVFTEDKFDKIVTKDPIANFDFGSINLQPGDFMYFFAGGSKKVYEGDEHMVTISRRSNDGILWSVTNYPGTSERFIIQEVPFWNPNNPGASFVKELAAGKNPAYFSTGQKGFDLWRLKPGQLSVYDLIKRTNWKKMAIPR